MVSQLCNSTTKHVASSHSSALEGVISLTAFFVVSSKAFRVFQSLERPYVCT